MSDILRKLKSKSGSVLLFALFLLVLVSTITISFSKQVGNQIKSTMNLDNDIQEKYDAESNIEESIANFIESINLVWKDDIEKVEEWEKVENNQITKYPVAIKYIYYDVEYESSVDIKEVVENEEKVTMKIRAKQIAPKCSTNDTLKIFSHTIPTAKYLNIDEFDGKKDQIITFQLDITELNGKGENDDIKSCIEVNLSNIGGDNGSEVCKVNYKVVYWRKGD